jgi:hypothetical protein
MEGFKVILNITVEGLLFYFDLGGDGSQRGLK